MPFTSWAGLRKGIWGRLSWEAIELLALWGRSGLLVSLFEN